MLPLPEKRDKIHDLLVDIQGLSDEFYILGGSTNDFQVRKIGMFSSGCMQLKLYALLSPCTVDRPAADIFERDVQQQGTELAYNTSELPAPAVNDSGDESVPLL